MASPFDIKASQSALQSSSDPSQDYCGIDNLPENMTVPEKSISSEPSVETVKASFPEQSSLRQSQPTLLNSTSVVSLDHFYFPQAQPSLKHLEPGEKEAKPLKKNLHFQAPIFFQAFLGKIKDMRSFILDSPPLLETFAKTINSSLKDPELGVTFDENFTPLQSAGEGGGVLSPQNKTEAVTKHKVVFSDMNGNEIPQPNYLKKRTYYGIEYKGNDFKYFDPYGVQGATLVEDLSRDVDLTATADLIPEQNGSDYIAFLPHPTGYQVTVAYNQKGERLKLYQTVAEDYFVKLSSSSEEKISWNLAKEKKNNFNFFHNSPQFLNQVNVHWNSIDSQLPQLAKNAYFKEGMQLFLDYFMTRTSYGWNNYSSAQSKEGLARDLFAQSNCSAANLMAADLLSQQGIPVRFVTGYTAEGIQHAWLEAKIEDSIKSFEHWEIVDFTGKIRNATSPRVPLAASAQSFDESQKIKLPNVMRGNEIKPVQDLKD